MAEMGLGYGSEYHLLRWMGRHRRELDDLVQRKVGCGPIEWLDFGFDTKELFPDREIVGADFLPEDAPARSEWKTFWPTTGTQQNWDAVAKIRMGEETEWLLVEAKAHIEEIDGPGCKAKGDGLSKIKRAFRQTIEGISATGTTEEWLGRYYQYANRLAASSFLNANGEKTRLLFIYFLGDAWRSWTCPTDAEGWEPKLKEVHQHLGLTGESEIEKRVHNLYLPVSKQ